MLKTLIPVLLIAASSYAAYHYLQSKETLQVETVSIEQGPIKNVINLTGRVINDKTVTLSALVNGQITEMKIAKGQVVEKNQVLARFDRREADAELTRLKAEEELAIEKEKLAHNTLQRLLNMGPNGSVSQQQLDDAQTERQIAAAQLKVSRSAYKIASIQREKYAVTAPFAGVITEKTTEVGQWLEAGTPLFTLVALEGREIEVNIDSSDRGQIKLGQQANLTADAWPDKPWVEKIHWLAPAVSNKEKQALNDFTARLTLGPDAPPLILGQQVDVELILDEKQDVLKLPYSVLIEKDNKKWLALVNDQQQIDLRPIETGIEDITHFELLTDIDRQARIALPQDQPFEQGQTVASQ